MLTCVSVACAQICTGLVEGMVLLAYPNAEIGQLWNTTLCIFAFLILSYIFNLYLAKYLPLAEGIMLILHVVGILESQVVLDWLTNHVLGWLSYVPLCL
jgi:choline transport protein